VTLFGVTLFIIVDFVPVVVSAAGWEGICTALYNMEMEQEGGLNDFAG
jgi:hypothetical protein